MARDERQLDLFGSQPAYTPTPAVRVAPPRPTTEPAASIDRAAAGAGEAWNALADAAIRWLAGECEEFTADDVWDRISGPPNSARALGARMQQARRDGLIEPTMRYVDSSRASCHYRPIRVWRSLVYRPNQPR